MFRDIVSGHLAVIRSKEEQLMYSTEMTKKNVSQAWIGVHDAFREGQYLTVLGERLEDVGYANWTNVYGRQEPDNAAGNQHCINIVSRGGGMDDNFCFTTLPYICQIPLSAKARNSFSTYILHMSSGIKFNFEYYI